MSVEFYNKNAEKFFKDTLKADMNYLYRKFLDNISVKNGEILDLGCGSGRDSKFFKELGFKILPMDLSEELAKKASEYLGQKVIVQDMKELDYENRFTGVWACASILHLKLEDVGIVLEKVFKSLKKDGVFYASFKYGENDYIKDDRYFTCFTEERFFKNFPKYKKNCIEVFQTFDVRKERENEKWFNIILKK
ncbi:class I SAM-dependent methyltransferase [Fusobacterium sp.]|uniref:class I SAM-dependent methyltransferase n=1 Tax=Fusobacterium sp. TaxID=68766 RepID=UPI0026207695|nr:class I SAM-dependent methyltransferase [Fusobacterium sp.]